MRRCDDVVEVTCGRVHGVQAPARFRWRHQAWRVSAVLAHWVETGAWWESPAARDVIGSRDPVGLATGARPRVDLLAEQEWWRVEAHRSSPSGPSRCPRLEHTGVFDLLLDRADARWRLVGCAD